MRSVDARWQRESWQREMRRRRVAQWTTELVAAAILGSVALVAIFAAQLAPADPLSQALDRRLEPPSWLGGSADHPLGTDHLGRDVLSRLIYGARVSLAVGGLSVLLSAGVGVPLGLWSGYAGGLVDETVMRLVDVQNAFPFIVGAITVVAVFGSSVPLLVLTLSIWGWASYARVVRGDLLALKRREFVVAARAVGADQYRIVLRHLFPNVVSIVVVLATFQVAALIVAESSLSFLGLGVPAPTPTWGSMLADGRGHLDDAWWIATFPILAIMLTVLSINLLGDALRDRSDPRLRT